MAKKVTTFRLDDEVIDFLQQSQEKLGAKNLTEVLNIIITAFRNDKKNKNTILSDDNLYVKSKLKNDKGTNEIRINLTNKQIKYLKDFGKFHGYTTNNKIAKFILLDKIYSQKVLTKLDIYKLSQISHAVFSACINFNQLVTQINMKKGENLVNLQEKIIDSIDEVKSCSKIAKDFIKEQSEFLSINGLK